MLSRQVSGWLYAPTHFAFFKLIFIIESRAVFAGSSIDLEALRLQGRRAITNYDPSSKAQMILPSPSFAIKTSKSKAADGDLLSKFVDFVGESVIPKRMSEAGWK